MKLLSTILFTTALLTANQGIAGTVYVGKWGGVSPASFEITSPGKVKVCFKSQCQANIPFEGDGSEIVLTNKKLGKRWIYKLIGQNYLASYLELQNGTWKRRSNAVLKPQE